MAKVDASNLYDESLRDSLHIRAANSLCSKAALITKEQIQKAMACGSAEELMALAKAEGMELTKEEAEAYLAELSVRDLDDGEMQAVAGGKHRHKSRCDEHCDRK